MSLCVELQQDGTLVVVGEEIQTCAAYVLLTPGEAAWVDALHEAFATPTAEQAVGWFAGAFGFVFGCFILGRLLSFFPAMFKTH